MNKIEFGNYLYHLRKERKMKQSYVGSKLGVTDKAVSKWENGKSELSLEKLKKLSVLYCVPLDSLLDKQITEEEANVKKIVLTGGPCAGKTTALTWINNYFSNRGYNVLFVPETATELISNGVAP